MLIGDAVVKDFQSDRVARIWSGLELNHINRMDLGDLKGLRDNIQEILEEICSHVNFQVARRVCSPLEKVFFNSLATRVDELKAVLEVIDVAEGLREHVSSRGWNTLTGPTCGQDQSFWFGSVLDHELDPTKPVLCPAVAEQYIENRLNSGASILDEMSASKLKKMCFSAKEIQAYMIEAETHLYQKARRAGGLTNGNYRFGTYISPVALKTTFYGDYSAFELSPNLQLSGLGVLEMIDWKINIEARTALSTRELFYKALGESNEAWILRPLVPLAAKSLNETLLNGLRWFSELKLRGIMHIPEDKAPHGLGVILNYVLNPESEQTERGEALLRYACLSLDEIRYILRAETRHNNGVPFTEDRFRQWGYLNHVPMRNRISATCPEPVELVMREMLK